MTSRTGAIGVDIASDKSLTNSLLSSAGLPVPKSRGRALGRWRRRTRRRKIGYPVVVKPLDGNHGRGVSLDLRTEEDVRRAFFVALRREPLAATWWSSRTSPATTTACW